MITTQYSLLNGTVFSAMQAAVQNRDTSALANEEGARQTAGTKRRKRVATEQRISCE